MSAGTAECGALRSLLAEVREALGPVCASQLCPSLESDRELIVWRPLGETFSNVGLTIGHLRALAQLEGRIAGVLEGSEPPAKTAICAYCGGHELKMSDPDSAAKMADHVISCVKNPLVKMLKDVSDALDPVLQVWEKVSAFSREPKAFWLKRRENEFYLNTLVVELNKLRSAIDGMKATTPVQGAEATTGDAEGHNSSGQAPAARTGSENLPTGANLTAAPQLSGVAACVTQKGPTPLESEGPLGGAGEIPDNTSDPGAAAVNSLEETETPIHQENAKLRDTLKAVQKMLESGKLTRTGPHAYKLDASLTHQALDAVDAALAGEAGQRTAEAPESSRPDCEATKPKSPPSPLLQQAIDALEKCETALKSGGANAGGDTTTYILDGNAVYHALNSARATLQALRQGHGEASSPSSSESRVNPVITGLLEENAELLAQLSKTENILARKGYRKSCDIPACNCGDNWSHGGLAEDRLREIADEVWENGKTALQSVVDLKTERDTLRAQLKTAGEALRNLVTKLDAINADPSFSGLWGLALAHDYKYTGPNWGEEYKAAQAALAALNLKGEA